MNKMCLYVKSWYENHSYPYKIHEVQGGSYHSFLTLAGKKEKKLKHILHQHKYASKKISIKWVSMSKQSIEAQWIGYC